MYRNLLSDPGDTTRNKGGGLRVTYHCYAFAHYLYLFGYSNSLIPFHWKRSCWWQLSVRPAVPINLIAW